MSLGLTCVACAYSSLLSKAECCDTVCPERMLSIHLSVDGHFLDFCEWGVGKYVAFLLLLLLGV